MFLQFIFQQPIDNLDQLGNVINKKVTTKAGGIIPSPVQIQKKINSVCQEPKCMSHDSFTLHCIYRRTFKACLFY